MSPSAFAQRIGSKDPVAMFPNAKASPKNKNAKRRSKKPLDLLLPRENFPPKMRGKARANNAVQAGAKARALTPFLLRPCRRKT